MIMRQMEVADGKCGGSTMVEVKVKYEVSSFGNGNGNVLVVSALSVLVVIDIVIMRAKTFKAIVLLTCLCLIRDPRKHTAQSHRCIYSPKV